MADFVCCVDRGMTANRVQISLIGTCRVYDCQCQYIGFHQRISVTLSSLLVYHHHHHHHHPCLELTAVFCQRRTVTGDHSTAAEDSTVHWTSFGKDADTRAASLSTCDCFVFVRWPCNVFVIMPPNVRNNNINKRR